MGLQRFPRAHRLSRRSHFQRAFRLRCTAADQTLLVFGHPNDLQVTRLGLSVSRKLGGAVQRNRWKRCIREAFRLSGGQLPQGIDLVVVPRAGQEPQLGQIRQSLVRLAGRVARKLQT
ncbi:MAG: ribonuclease P protein component [Thermoguttaceae bacterium]|jgi:ribonuclease P protein component